MDFDFQSFLPQLYPIGQVLAAIILGGIIGWQRGIRGKDAGTRTYALVTAGSTLFTVLSVLAFDKDPARIAAQVITGIGFLGAGVILHREDRTIGLTTAAGLWISAAIGMAIGLGFYLMAVIVSILVLIVFVIDDNRWVKIHSHDLPPDKKI
ncbi:MAG: magnesium transporter MgtC [Candidatus Magasanikbacteria bacterium CG10_big_fil_rev_8_21_14_0_10_36_32]|uniref:Magnesium transporter MgtC n=1 Tax=Candidatus Magasanikbacteria bacterium CG10_big_fil_rev_8_21_14_0_10_36_32 TaxID=1974646 RepID=A0A2M6W724_9BACT|nr:MAG: magnesium transporter MgtC [Candidatus Magasanikbacteria bacterium CG10_big_fil_rev_8_21_14_0_10_36_32]